MYCSQFKKPAPSALFFARRLFLISALAWAFLFQAGCEVEPANDGFCGIIPKKLEAALSYGTSLYLGLMPNEAFLQEEQDRDVRRIPPVEVREDVQAIDAVVDGRCAFSIFEESSVADRAELKDLKSAQLLYGNPESAVFRVYFNPFALRSEESRTMTLEYLSTLWSDEFQDKLEFYGLKPVPEELREQVRQELPVYLKAPEPR
ncbi:MAG: hypothetical protein RH862_06610 [Leptospiraceae bacterium]